MSNLKATIVSDHPVVFVADPTWLGDIPPDLGYAPIVATDACIAIETKIPSEGATTIVLSTTVDNPARPPAFEGDLLTPGRTVAVTGSDAEPILSMTVAGDKAHIRVWVNKSQEPDHITIEAR